MELDDIPIGSSGGGVELDDIPMGSGIDLDTIPMGKSAEAQDFDAQWGFGSPSKPKPDPTVGSPYEEAQARKKAGLPTKTGISQSYDDTTAEAVLGAFQGIEAALPLGDQTKAPLANPNSNVPGAAVSRLAGGLTRGVGSFMAGGPAGVMADKAAQIGYEQGLEAFEKPSTYGSVAMAGATSYLPWKVGQGSMQSLLDDTGNALVAGGKFLAKNVGADLAASEAQTRMDLYQQGIDADSPEGRAALKEARLMGGVASLGFNALGMRSGVKTQQQEAAATTAAKAELDATQRQELDRGAVTAEQQILDEMALPPPSLAKPVEITDTQSLAAQVDALGQEAVRLTNLDPNSQEAQAAGIRYNQVKKQLDQSDRPGVISESVAEPVIPSPKLLTDQTPEGVRRQQLEAELDASVNMGAWERVQAIRDELDGLPIEKDVLIDPVQGSAGPSFFELKPPLAGAVRQAEPTLPPETSIPTQGPAMEPTPVMAGAIPPEAAVARQFADFTPDPRQAEDIPVPSIVERKFDTSPVKKSEIEDDGVSEAIGLPQEEWLKLSPQTRANVLLNLKNVSGKEGEYAAAPITPESVKAQLPWADDRLANIAADKYSAMLGLKEGDPNVSATREGQGQEAGNPVNPTAGYGSSNKLVTREMVEEAQRRYLEKLSANSPFDPDTYAYVAKVGAYHIEAGTREFAQWSAKMIEDLGESVRPHLQQVWENMQSEKSSQPLPESMPPPKTGDTSAPRAPVVPKPSNLYSRDAALTPTERELMGRVHLGPQPKREGTLLNPVDKVMQKVFTKHEAVDKVSRIANEKLKESGAEPSIPGTTQYIDPSKDPAISRRQLHGDVGVAEGILDGAGVKDFNTKEVVAPSLKSILNIVPPEGVDKLKAYMVARRSLEVEGSDRATGVDPSTAAGMVEALKGSEYEKAFQGIRDWQNAVLKYAVDSGLLDPQTADNFLEAGKDYIPLRRLMKADEVPDEFMQRNGGIAGVRNLWKKLEGSERKIMDPINSMIENAHAIHSAATKNETMLNLVNLKDMDGMEAWIKPSEEGDPNAVRVKRGGQAEYYNLDPDLLRDVKGLGNVERSIWNKLLSIPAGLQRAGVVLDPAFQVANIFRDSILSAVLSKNGLKPFEGVAKSILAQMTPDRRAARRDLIEEWKASGAGQSLEQGYFYDLDKRAEITGAPTQNTKVQRGMRIAGSVLKPLQKLAEVSERTTRLAEYEKAKSIALKAGLSEKDAQYYAAFSSRNLMDFAEGGEATQALKGPAAFFGSALQGERRAWNALNFKRDKAGASKAALKGMAYLTLPSIAMFINNMDDEEYLTAPQAKRDLMWGVRIPEAMGGKLMWLPKPPGILGWGFTVPVERAMMFALKNDPEGFKNWSSGLVGNIPNPIPTALRAPFETMANYSVFRDAPIESRGMEDDPKELRYDHRTSLLSRNLAGAAKSVGVPLSPAKLDYLKDSMFGTLGRRATSGMELPIPFVPPVPGIDDAISLATGEKAPKRPELLSRFQNQPDQFGGEVFARFYDKLDTMKEESSRQKAGGKAEVNLTKLSPMIAASKQISELRKKMTEADDDVTRADIRRRMAAIAAKYVDLPEGITPQRLRRPLAGAISAP